LDHGRHFVISTTGNGPVNPFIQSATLDGASITRTYISHDEIMNGGILNFQMGPLPNQNWGVGSGDATPAPSELGIVTAPVIQAASNVFGDSLEISIASLTPGASVSFAMMNGSTVGSFKKYERPLTIKTSQVVLAYAEKTGLRASRTVRAVFSKFSPPGTIKLNTQYSPQYTGGGDEALIDGRRGNTDFRLGAWQGYEGTDLDAVIDLGSIKQVTRVQVGCLQDNNSWIFFPRSVEFSFSSGGVTFGPPTVLTNTVSEKDEAIQIKEFSADLVSVNARYVRVHARSVGRCPEWHKGAGNKAWLFADEITVLTR
jgi:hypothetical protein